MLADAMLAIEVATWLRVGISYTGVEYVLESLEVATWLRVGISYTQNASA